VFRGENMLDPTLVSVLLGILAVVGTLGGALGGTILANRHARKLEELRIAQEKLKQKTVIIEEVYTLLTNITAQISTNVDYKRPFLEGKPLQDDLRRIQTLIFLYLPSLKDKLDEFMKSLIHFSTMVTKEQKSNEPPTVWANVKPSFKDYLEKTNAVKAELESMVR
jgi:gas vesicle protein